MLGPNVCQGWDVPVDCLHDQSLEAHAVSGHTPCGKLEHDDAKRPHVC